MRTPYDSFVVGSYRTVSVHVVETETTHCLAILGGMRIYFSLILEDPILLISVERTDWIPQLIDRHNTFSAICRSVEKVLNAVDLHDLVLIVAPNQFQFPMEAAAKLASVTNRDPTEPTPR